MGAPGRILAIDFGSKKLGIAVSDPRGVVAHPVTIVPRTEMPADLDAIGELLEEYSVVRIVVGNPLTLSGERGPQAEAADKFCAALEKAFGLPVDVYDERLSSKEADRILREMGIRGRRARGVIDKVAAALVLQSYLDSRSGRAAP